MLAKSPDPGLKMFGYDSLTKFNDVVVLRNNYAQPLGVVYDKGMDEHSFKQLSNNQKDIYLFRGCVVDSGDNELASAIGKYTIADTPATTTLNLYYQSAQDLAKKSLKITKFREDHINGEVTTSSPNVLFFSIPYDEGWKAMVNGKESKIHRVNCGFVGLLLPAGKNTVDLKFTPRYMKEGGIITLIALIAFGGLLFLTSREKTNEPAAA